MHVSITRAATTRVRNEFARLGHMSAAVFIYRAPADADLKRGPRGGIIWDIKRSGPWQAQVCPLVEGPELERAEANGITFLILAVEPHVPAAFKVSVQGSKLHVAAAA